MKNWLTGVEIDKTILESKAIGRKTMTEIEKKIFENEGTSETGSIVLADLEIKNKTVKGASKKNPTPKAKIGTLVLPPGIKLHWYESQHTLFYPNPIPLQLTPDNVAPNKSTKATLRHLLTKEYPNCNSLPGMKFDVVTIDFMAYFYKRLPAYIKTIEEVATFFAQKIAGFIDNGVTIAIVFDKGQFGSLTKLATQVNETNKNKNK